ncbi:MAG: hypothetical protein JWR19_3516 [Pedosphaera sp.]|nr:hypothetical protein [Pedosphaera sp.]
MPLNLRIIHSNDFLKTTATGEFDRDTSKQALIQIAAANQAPHNHDVLLDVRNASSHLTMLDIIDLVNLMVANRSSFHHKLAILTHEGAQFDRAKFMELYANNRGFHVAGFDDFEESFSWLTDSSPVVNSSLPIAEELKAVPV